MEKFKIFTEEIQKDSTLSLESMNLTNEVMQKIPLVSKTIKETVEGNFNAINSIKSDVENFVASFQQISTAASEITAAMNSLSTETEEIVYVINTLDKDIEKLNSIKEEINNMDTAFMAQNKGYYQKFMENSSEVTKKELTQILENARRQHGLWMDILEEAVTESKIIPLQVDASRCALGHFYSSLTIQDEDIRELWESIDEHHNNLHEAGKQALLHIRNQELEEAKKHHQIAKESSQKVNQIIDEITGILSK